MLSSSQIVQWTREHRGGEEHVWEGPAPAPAASGGEAGLEAGGEWGGQRGVGLPGTLRWGVTLLSRVLGPGAESCSPSASWGCPQPHRQGAGGPQLC